VHRGVCYTQDVPTSGVVISGTSDRIDGCVEVEWDDASRRLHRYGQHWSFDVLPPAAATSTAHAVSVAPAAADSSASIHRDSGPVAHGGMHRDGGGSVARGGMHRDSGNVGHDAVADPPRARDLQLHGSHCRGSNQSEAGADDGPFDDALLESLAPGTRVMRGPMWSWEDQDGGEGSFGTVVNAELAEDTGALTGWLRVRWDAGGVNRYRWGANDCYDLVVAPDAATELWSCEHPHALALLATVVGATAADVSCSVCGDADALYTCRGGVCRWYCCPACLTATSTAATDRYADTWPVGTLVRLAPDFDAHGDAGRGPMLLEDVGVVVNVDESDQPYCVYVPAMPRRLWWYSARALRTAVEVGRGHPCVCAVAWSSAVPLRGAVRCPLSWSLRRRFSDGDTVVALPIVVPSLSFPKSCLALSGLRDSTMTLCVMPHCLACAAAALSSARMDVGGMRRRLCHCPLSRRQPRDRWRARRCGYALWPSLVGAARKFRGGDSH
jgi:hypothetical protein